MNMLYIALFIALVWVFAACNKLVKLKPLMQETWNAVDARLRKCYALIRILIEAAQETTP